MWLLEPFKEELTLKSLFSRFMISIFAGLFVLVAIQSFAHYDFEQADTLSKPGGGCYTLEMALLLVCPFIEEPLFRILPHKYLGNKACFIGSIIWAILHILGRNFAIVGFQIIMSVFYFKLASSKRYKETLAFHEVFNGFICTTCFI